MAKNAKRDSPRRRDPLSRLRRPLIPLGVESAGKDRDPSGLLAVVEGAFATDEVAPRRDGVCDECGKPGRVVTAYWDSDLCPTCCEEIATLDEARVASGFSPVIGPTDHTGRHTMSPNCLKRPSSRYRLRRASRLKP